MALFLNAFPGVVLGFQWLLRTQGRAGFWEWRLGVGASFGGSAWMSGWMERKIPKLVYPGAARHGASCNLLVTACECSSSSKGSGLD